MPAVRDLILNLQERRQGNALLAAANDLDKLAHGADVAGDSFARMKNDTVHLNAEIEKTRAHVKDLYVQFARTGDKGLFGDITAAERDLRRLDKALKAVMPDGQETVGIGFGLPTGRPRAMAIAGLVAIVAAAAPGLGAMISGAVVGTAAGGGIIGGIVAAAHDSRVKSAWKDFSSGLTKESFGSEAFVEPTIAGIQTIKQGLADLNLAEVLGQGAPAVETLAEGVVGFAKGVLPGLDAAMRTSDKSAHIMADGFADVGSAFGEMIRDFTEKEGTFDGLATLFHVLTGAVKVTHATVGFLTDSFETLLGPSEAAARALEMITVIPGLRSFFGDQADQIHAMRTGTEGLVPQLSHLSEATMLNNAGLDPFVGYLKAATRETGAFAGALSDLFAGQLDVDKSTLAWKQDVLDLKEAVKEHGRSVADNTEEGLANQRMIQGLIDDAMAIREATRQQTGSTDLANAAYMRQIAVLKDLLKQLGFTKDQIDKMVGDYEINVRVNVFGAGSSGAAPQIIKNLKLEDKLAGGRASGGPVQARSTYLVGESGPELLTMGPQSGYVHPSANAAMGGGAQALEVHWMGSANRVIDALFEEFRIRVRGLGGAQAAFS